MFCNRCLNDHLQDESCDAAWAPQKKVLKCPVCAMEDGKHDDTCWREQCCLLHSNLDGILRAVDPNRCSKDPYVVKGWESLRQFKARYPRRES